MRYCVLRRGFTMIELLVVIVIIGVLAGALMPAVFGFLRKGDDAVSRNNLMRLGRAAISYRADHDNCYPSAGGVIFPFTWRDPANNQTKEKRFGRSRGWVYFGHSCPRGADATKVGDGNAYAYGLGSADDDAGKWINEEGCCTCFSSSSDSGGISPSPADWYGSKAGEYSQAELAIMNGALFLYMDSSLKSYVDPTFVTLASQKLGVSKQRIARSYAMNIVTSADKEIYDTERGGYQTVSSVSESSHGNGRNSLTPYVDSTNMSSQTPMANRVALFVELNVDDEGLKTSGDLAGDQVWDWDNGNESMGFIHEDHGIRYAHVVFADGHVEAIRDPSDDSEQPDTARREKLSKWYGSGGLSSSGEKLD